MAIRTKLEQHDGALTVEILLPSRSAGAPLVNAEHGQRFIDKVDPLIASDTGEILPVGDLAKIAVEMPIAANTAAPEHDCAGISDLIAAWVSDDASGELHRIVGSFDTVLCYLFQETQSAIWMDVVGEQYIALAGNYLGFRRGQPFKAGRLQ